MDVVIRQRASVFNQEPAKMTERLLKAVSNPILQSLAIPPRLQLRRDAYQFDMDAILTAAAKHKVAMEFKLLP